MIDLDDDDFDLGDAIDEILGFLQRHEQNAHKPHHHRCPIKACGHIWSHRMADMRPDDFEAAHTCPKCGVGKITMKCQPDGTPLTPCSPSPD